MRLEKFTQRSEALVKEFHEYWIRNNKNKPDDWPMELALADWEEQFICYIEDRVNEF